MRLWFETWFEKVDLGSRDSVALETWFAKDIRTDKASPKEAHI
jgi:hypothetical protein